MNDEDFAAIVAEIRRYFEVAGLVEIGLEMLGTQAVIDAERPGLEMGEGAVDPGPDDMGGHISDDMRVVGQIRRARIGGPAGGPVLCRARRAVPAAIIPARRNSPGA